MIVVNVKLKGTTELRTSIEKSNEIVVKILGKGDSGYTPVKGIDYFTEADKNELVEKISFKNIESINIEDIDRLF